MATPSSRDRAYGQAVGDTGVRVERTPKRVGKWEAIAIRWVVLAVVIALVAPAIIWLWRLAFGLS